MARTSGRKEVAIGLIGQERYLRNPELVRLQSGFSLLDLKRYVEGRGYVAALGQATGEVVGEGGVLWVGGVCGAPMRHGRTWLPGHLSAPTPPPQAKNRRPRTAKTPQSPGRPARV